MPAMSQKDCGTACSCAFPHLFTPIQVGGMTVKNRMFMSAMSTGLCDNDNCVTQRAIDYYAARAKGGVGLITTENVMVDENSHYSIPNNMGLYRDEHIPGVRKLAEEVHRYGAKLAVQLLHAGPAATARVNGGRQPVAASAIPMRNVGEMPRAMTLEEIQAFVHNIGQAARRAREAGVDAVEVHAAHRHGVLGTFLSPLSNKRVDKYGGDVDGRMRLLLEAVEEVRRQTTPDYPIIVRMSMTEIEPGGQSMMEAIHIARRLEQAGVNMLHLSNGTLETFWKTVTPDGTPQCVNSELSQVLKDAIHIPVGVIGRNSEPWAVEQVLELGRTDVVYMGRALLCDPEFPNKLKEGRTEDIRPCIGCTDCITHVQGPGAHCTMNPFVGREGEPEPKAEPSRKVLVVGGGAAGLQAATAAARRGCQVTLLEESGQLGGQMFLAGIPIAKHDIVLGTKYLIRQAEQAGVDIRCGVRCDRELVRQMAPDAVVLATGGRPVVPGFLKGAKQLVSAWDVLAGRVTTGQHIVVVGGGAVGCETADFLIHPQNDRRPGGKQVTIIEMADNLMKEDRSYGRSLLVRRLQEKGCTILTSAKVEEVQGEELAYSYQEERHVIHPVDTVVCALGVRPENSLAEELKGLGIPVYLAGDAEKSGRIYQAIASGQAAGESL